MHKNDSEPRVLFGKGYFWSETDDGRLGLVSVSRALEVLAEFAGDDG